MKHRKGLLHPNWKGQFASYSAIHHWIKRELGSPLRCDNCDKTDGGTRNFQWANLSGKYLRDLSDWTRLCVRCHTFFDGRERVGVNNLSLHPENLGNWLGKGHVEFLPPPKLNTNQVRAIRDLKGKKTQQQIAKMFNVTQSSISRILNNKSRSLSNATI